MFDDNNDNSVLGDMNTDTKDEPINDNQESTTDFVIISSNEQTDNNQSINVDEELKTEEIAAEKIASESVNDETLKQENKSEDPIAQENIYQEPVRQENIYQEPVYKENNNASRNINSNKTKTKLSKNLKIGLICAGAVVALSVLVTGVIIGVKNIVEKSGRSENVASITVGPSKKPEATKAASETLTQSTDSAIAEIKTSESTNNGDSIADVVENVMPAIVKINCTSLSTVTDFFGRPYEEEVAGSGSGIIIGQNDNQILIATNNHVVDGAKTVTVVFSNDEEIEADVKGTDSSADLAVVSVKTSKIDSETLKNLKIASLGNSDNCEVGETAIAIGNALGYGQSVTVGVISAVNRELAIEDSSMTLIQTDAAINPGNSGGALINSKGEVIGINSVKYVSEDTEGMGYAIPISAAIPIINELMNYEEINDSEKAYLGIIGKDIDSTSAERYGAVEGIAVQEVSQGSPAEKAGVVRGDIVTKIDGRKATTMAELQNILSKKKGGTSCNITIYRYSQGEYSEKNVTVTFGARGDYE